VTGVQYEPENGSIRIRDQEEGGLFPDGRCCCHSSCANLKKEKNFGKRGDQGDARRGPVRNSPPVPKSPKELDGGVKGATKGKDRTDSKWGKNDFAVPATQEKQAGR